MQQVEKLPEIISEDYRDFLDVEGSILYLDPPYESTTGYNEVSARTLPDEVYQRVRADLLDRPRGTEVLIDGFACKLGTDVNNYNRLYVRDTQAKPDFDSQEFYNWAFEMATHSIVLISSYVISDDRFSTAYVFDKARSTLAGGNIGDKTEKLFMPTWQLKRYTVQQLELF